MFRYKKYICEHLGTKNTSVNVKVQKYICERLGTKNTSVNVKVQKKHL